MSSPSQYTYYCTWVTWLSRKQHNHPIVIYTHITSCYLSYLVFTSLGMLYPCFTRKLFQLSLGLSIQLLKEASHRPSSGSTSEDNKCGTNGKLVLILSWHTKIQKVNKADSLSSVPWFLHQLIWRLSCFRFHVQYSILSFHIFYLFILTIVWLTSDTMIVTAPHTAPKKQPQYTWNV